jgi:hypothetical protein
MRIFFLVLLLILNVYAEAKSSGSARSRSQTKKENVTVVEKKTVLKTEVESAQTEPISTTSVAPISTTSVATTSEVAKKSENNAVVRDTIVDTVYVVMPESAERPGREETNVPLPHQSAFLGQGLSVGVGAGLFNASKDCDCLGVWQGQLEYHYRDYITGGFDVRFFGGTLDSDVMLMYQRYRLNVRFHRGFTGADFYISPLFGLETTDLSEFRKELRDGVSKDGTSGEAADVASSSGDSPDSLEVEKNCEKMFSLDGFTFGVEAGMGLVLFRYLGLSAAASYEFNLSWTQLVSFSPGVAFNLREVWPWASQNLRSTWISFEVIFQRYFNRDVNEWAVAGFIGFQIGI